MFCFFWLWGMWGICSLTRDWAHTLCIGSSLNHRPSGKSLKHFNDRRIIVVNGSSKATCAKHWAQHKWSRYSLRDDWLFCRATVIDKESVQLNHVHDPMDCNPPGSSVHGILKARILDYKNTGLGNHSLLQGFFFTKDKTQVSSVAGRLLTIWAKGP